MVVCALMYNSQYSRDTLASIFGMESILQRDTPGCPIERRGEISTGFQF